MSKDCSSWNSENSSVQTWSSCPSSGMIRNVRQPRIFLLFKISPKMWSPMYKTFGWKTFDSCVSMSTTKFTHIFSFRSDKPSEDVTWTTRKNLTFFQLSEISSDLEMARCRLHLSQNRSFAKEKRLLGVNHDRVEICFPISVRVLSTGSVRKVEEISHNPIRESILAVGEQENLGPRLMYAIENERQARIFFHVIFEILDGLRFQLAMNVHPINRASDVLKDRFEWHEQLSALHSRLLAVILRMIGEKVHEASVHISFGKVEESVEHVHARLIQLEELVGVDLINAGMFQELEAVNTHEDCWDEELIIAVIKPA